MKVISSLWLLAIVGLASAQLSSFGKFSSSRQKTVTTTKSTPTVVEAAVQTPEVVEPAVKTPEVVVEAAVEIPEIVVPAVVTPSAIHFLKSAAKLADAEPQVEVVAPEVVVEAAVEIPEIVVEAAVEIPEIVVPAVVTPSAIHFLKSSAKLADAKPQEADVAVEVINEFEEVVEDVVNEVTEIVDEVVDAIAVVEGTEEAAAPHRRERRGNSTHEGTRNGNETRRFADNERVQRIQGKIDDGMDRIRNATTERLNRHPKLQANLGKAEQRVTDTVDTVRRHYNERTEQARERINSATDRMQENWHSLKESISNKVSRGTSDDSTESSASAETTVSTESTDSTVLTDSTVSTDSTDSTDSTVSFAATVELTV